MQGLSLSLSVAMLALGLACLAPLGVFGTGVGECKYTTALGFNPFERWNVVTLGELNTVGGHFEGRIAAQSVKLETASVNTNPKRYALKSDTLWAVTVHNTQDGEECIIGGDPATVINGGTEAQGQILGSTGTIYGDVISVDSSVAFTLDGRISGVVQSKTPSSIATQGGAPAAPTSINNTLALSVNFAEVGNYFKQLSTYMSNLEDNIIHSTIDAESTNVATMVVRLRGKVNVMKFTRAMSYLYSLETILLKGHPKGILIINIDHVGDLGSWDIPMLKGILVQYEADGATKESAFGRVLLNFHNAIGVGLIPYSPDSGVANSFDSFAKQIRTARPQQKDNELLAVSILAPFAQVRSTGGFDLKGNIISKTLTFDNGAVLTQPFGSFPRGTGAHPVGTGGTHKPPGAGACWWGLL